VDGVCAPVRRVVGGRRGGGGLQEGSAQQSYSTVQRKQVGAFVRQLDRLLVTAGGGGHFAGRQCIEAVHRSAAAHCRSAAAHCRSGAAHCRSGAAHRRSAAAHCRSGAAHRRGKSSWELCACPLAVGVAVVQVVCRTLRS
jgi:hypothetical protein